VLRFLGQRVAPRFRDFKEYTDEDVRKLLQSFIPSTRCFRRLGWISVRLISLISCWQFRSSLLEQRTRGYDSHRSFLSSRLSPAIVTPLTGNTEQTYVVGGQPQSHPGSGCSAGGVPDDARCQSRRSAPRFESRVLKWQDGLPVPPAPGTPSSRRFSRRCDGGVEGDG
jgi:hypothetical protein